MKREFRLIKAFGQNEAGLADVPRKISGIKISRIVIGDDTGCSWCFPHGLETYNSHYVNYQRSWKKHRKTRWKHHCKILESQDDYEISSIMRESIFSDLEASLKEAVNVHQKSTASE